MRFLKITNIKTVELVKNLCTLKNLNKIRGNITN